MSRRRYGPLAAYTALLEFILAQLGLPASALKTPLVANVRPRYSVLEALPSGSVQAAVGAAASHLTSTSGMLISGRWSPVSNQSTLTRRCPVMDEYKHLQSNVTCIREGFGSNIDYRGRQQGETGDCLACGCVRKGMCANTRTDDNAQSAIGIAIAGKLLNDSRSLAVAKDIVEYLYLYSGAIEKPVNHSDGSRGLIDWFVSPAMSQKSAFYGDNDGTVFISSVAVAGLLGDPELQQRLALPLLQQAFGMLRTVSQTGYRLASTSKADMDARGWKPFFFSSVNIGDSGTSPDMQANAWALSLWAGQATGIKLFSERVYSATALLMAAWPDKWTCTCYMSEQLAHEVLVLAWLVRGNNTEETRGWLDAVATTLIAHQRQSGAIREWVNASCDESFLKNNEAYGTGNLSPSLPPCLSVCLSVCLRYLSVSLTHARDKTVRRRWVDAVEHRPGRGPSVYVRACVRVCVCVCVAVSSLLLIIYHKTLTSPCGAGKISPSCLCTKLCTRLVCIPRLGGGTQRLWMVLRAFS